MKIRNISLLLLCVAATTAFTAKAQNKDNTLSRKEIKEGWKLLWDGKTSEGWKSVRGGGFPSSGWTISNGVLSIADNDNAPSVGDIVTNRKYKNFELKVDFLYTDGANSGIKYFIQDARNGTVSTIGNEYQILDDILHPDAALGIDGNRKLGSFYDVLPARVNPPAKAGQWYTAKIVVKGNHVEHWLNGKKILEFDRDSDRWKEAIAKSKFNNTEGFGMAEDGYILLQDHGRVVSFKNIKIREM